MMNARICYLISYNGFSACGWLGLLLFRCLSNNGGTVLFLKVIQTAAALEIVHVALGIVKASIVITTLQVFSRLFIVWGIVHSVPETNTPVIMDIFLIPWCLTEVVRYAYYVFALVGLMPKLLSWLRYTLFIVLYPIGATGELLAVYAALPFVKHRKLYTLEMPNAFNVAFHYYYFLIAVMLIYVPGFPQMYCHMFSQRRKVLGPSNKKTE